MIKKLITVCCLLSAFYLAQAQPYGNEWIDYSKTYYKFKIGTNGLYRISFNTLLSAGIPSSQLRGTDFKMFRNGREVPLYVTTNNQFSAADYIEFYGERNDGRPDSLLYKDPNDQPDRSLSLFSDTATYFLTLDPFSINARIQQQINDLNGAPAPEEYCYNTILYRNYGAGIFTGFPISPFFPQLFSSDFSIGEGFNAGALLVNDNNTQSFLQPRFVYRNPNVNAFLRPVFTLGSGNHIIRTFFNTFDTTVSRIGPTVLRPNFTVNSMSILEGDARFTYRENVTGAKGYIAVTELQYPRLFNFDNQSKMDFQFLKNAPIYFEIRNFNTRSTAPVLYDLTNNQRYVGIVDTVVKFHLNGTAQNKNRLYLSSQAAEDITAVAKLTPVLFTNYLNAAQQGNYLIITNRKLTTSSTGTDFVEEYRKYRSSQTGGSFNAKTFYIDELNDQFGFGINQHPLAIRRFINFAIDRFSVKPELLYIIGKGFEYNYNYRDQGRIDKSLVQTYGNPASDNLLTARSPELNFPQLGVGRLAASKGDDIRYYLEKVKEYEATLNDTFPAFQTPFYKSWMKNVMHLGGGNNNFEQQLFRSYLDGYKNTIESPKYGATVASLFKNTTDPIQIAQNIFIDSLVNTGVSLITFFGHSATTTLDFNLVPESFNNKGRYHLMLSNGCFVGSIFNDFSSYSERFVLTPDKAAIGYIAPITYAVASNLNTYSTEFYNRFSNTMYNDKIGNILKETARQLVFFGGDLNPMLGHQMIYHGDPGLRINTHTRPDYYIDASSIQFAQQNINAATDSFLINVIVRNLGAATTQNYIVNIDRIFPNGQIQSTAVNVPSARNIDTVAIWVQSDRLNGPGLNTFKIKVDYADAISEYSETNNEVTITKIILADDIIPISPYEFCMVNDPNFELVFSTANPFATTKNYIFQI
ncbi:MAG: hypothetical protein IT274_04895, partial [Chitinophagales bacterium]|nr:hypothetical protein [Chitinophagales bacterium]